MKSNLVFVCILAIGLCSALGCEPQSQQGSRDNDDPSHDHPDSHADHSHDHGDHTHVADESDDHESAHGINGGHSFAFEPGEYSGEWLHFNDNDLIRVFILDKNGKSNLPVAADSVSVTRSDDAIFTLDPEKPDEHGLAATYVLEDKDLTIAMNLGVTIEMKIGDETYVAKIPPHKPHKH